MCFTTFMSHELRELGNDSGHEPDEEGSSGCVNIPCTRSYYSTLLFRGGGRSRSKRRRRKQGRHCPAFPLYSPSDCVCGCADACTCVFCSLTTTTLRHTRSPAPPVLSPFLLTVIHASQDAENAFPDALTR
ncbi:uncharacterized protein SCHCODRAFT_02333180 [Schizophyllum commune H4-8]|uniref:uncharacterized protein n=1 Tax=Schizophyllum commune (strain H4-8 / FGSC 9210) TaxID=578458 RepID=UPI00215F654D|nr:uncharacterized protein SCHCODRAFT_02333180 [Schizophyllum commune H4-8]KAI5889955.1 hypothetical protein SCHCODRAFT_02333180 [Schizophyllum commune H4-8]